MKIVNETCANVTNDYVENFLMGFLLLFFDPLQVCVIWLSVPICNAVTDTYSV